jgi:type IV pilus assembly protein PilB
MKLIPEELVRKHYVLPLGKEDGRLKIIISDPLDLDMLDLLRFRLNAELECCLASPAKIRTHILHTMDEVRSSIDATAAELAAAGHAIEAEIRKAEASQTDDEGPIVRLVNLMIDEAVRLRARIFTSADVDRVRTISRGGVVSNATILQKRSPCHRPHQNYVRHGHRRTPPAAGRPYQAECR